MPKCSFSGNPVKPGTGIMYVLKDGKILWFKNSKCQKNYLKLKRKSQNVRWTEAYRKEHKKSSESAVSKEDSKLTSKPTEKIAEAAK